MSPDRLWIVVADARRARVFERIAAGAHIEELPNLVLTAPPPRELRDRAPRVHDRMGPSRHVIEPRTSPARIVEERFLADVAKRLSALAEEKVFQGLVLCAPARAMGVLKQHLSTHAHALVRRQEIKDLANRPAPEIIERLSGLLNAPGAKE